MEKEDFNEILNRARVDCFLNKGLEKMHEIFRSRWKIYRNIEYPNENGEWEDSKECGKIIAEICCSSICRDFEEKLRNGKIDLWDITLTKTAILEISKALRNNGIIIDKKEDKFIYDLSNIRNLVAHEKYKLTDDEYLDYSNKLTVILVRAGENRQDVEAFKKSLMNDHRKVPENLDEKSIFVKLQKEANQLLKKNNFTDAIEKYSEALDISGILPDNLAIVYSNRSLARLKVDTPNSLLLAERDAKFAIQLSPLYWKGHFYLGKVQIKLEKWGEAQHSLDKAVALNPASKEALDERALVCKQIGVLSNHQLINPASQPPSLEEGIKSLCFDLGVTEQHANDTLNNLAKTNDTIKGDLLISENPPNYKEAAKCYAKAAAEGDIYGMYNLGELYFNGDGVIQDYREALFWFKKAATTKSNTDKAGVGESQNKIGYIYKNGLGVKKDYRQAVEWYQKAILNFNGTSANNLGVLYQQGKGVKKSAVKAFEYFKMSAKLGVIIGMTNLSKSYFFAEGTGSLEPTEEDIAEGMKWLRIVASRGDVLAIQELSRREKLSLQQHIEEFRVHLTSFRSDNFSNPIDQKQFGKEVKEAEKNGSKTAQKLLEIWDLMNSALEFFKVGENAEGTSSLSKVIHLDCQIVKIPEFLEPVIEEWHASHKNDIEAITCYLQINPMQKSEELEDYLAKFPNDEYLLEIRLMDLFNKGKQKEAIVLIENVLKLYPDSIQFIYAKAMVLSMHKPQPKETLNAFDKFLAVAPKDHENVPACHYRKAMYHMIKKDNPKFFQCFEAGMESEKKQLPCFLPYQFPGKNMLEKIFEQMKSEKEKSSLSLLPKPNLTKVLLKPERKALLLQQKAEFIQRLQKSFDTRLWNVQPQNTPKKPCLANLRDITLKYMDHIEDKIYNGCVLESRIIDWAFVAEEIIITIIEDFNGDVIRLAIYNWPKASNEIEVMKTFRPNTVVSIINPFMRHTIDKNKIIHVKGPSYINIDTSSCDKECHCCGNQAKLIRCEKCLVAQYCSKECQKVDYKIFNHKDVCKYLKKYPKFL